MTEETPTQQPLSFSISLTEDQIILIKKVILLCQGQAQMHGYAGIRAEAEKAEAIFDQATSEI
jgi:hypothetical protein